MPNNISNNSASRQKKWGSGSISVARRSSRAAASSTDHNIDFGPSNNNDFIEDNDDDDENLFESIGRELDKFKGEDDVNESKGVDEDLDKNEMDNDIIHDEELEVPTEAVVNGKLSISNADANVEHESNAVRKSAESVHNTTSSTGNNDNLNIQHANVINNSTSQNINDNEHCVAQSTKRKPRGGSSIIKTKLSPPRFSFQSHSSSAKPKSIKSNNKNNRSSTYKTPSNKSSLPSRELFSTSAMPQHKSTIKRSIQKSSGTNSSMLSTTQKRKRHSFRPSNSNAASTPAVNNNNVREMGFVPTFLSNAKSGGGSGANASPKDVPADDDDGDNNNCNHSTNDRDAFSKNMVTNFQQQQRQARKSESSSNTKSGYLVQRLRSLRNTDQRMAMRLRSGQYSSSSSSAAGISSSATTTGFTARKRRRSGGDHLDPKNAASSILDVTVSSNISTSYSERSGNASLLSEGKSVLPAYIHCYTAMKQPSSGQQSEHCKKGMLLFVPCYAWIVMSHDMMREQNVIMEEGDTGTTTKQLRLYDAVVIPPRVVNTNEQRRSELDDQVNQNHNLSCIQMPTIICTHICQEYPAEQLPLQDVSFDQFN